MVLRHLLRNWLRTQAARRLRDEALKAAQRQRDTTTEPAASPLGIVFALGIEAGGLEDLLDAVVTTRGHGLIVRQGRLKNRRLALILAGAGRQAAARATRALIAGHRPEWVLSAGFAGGLSPELKRHDVVIANSLFDTAGNRFPIELPPELGTAATAAGVHVGPLLTVDEVVRLPEAKRSLFRQHAAVAVDMESLAVAEACRGRQIGFLAVRVIHDAADDELPPDVEHLLAQTTMAARLGAAAGAIWRRPASAKDMYRLKENALVSSDRLGRFLARLIGQLPRQPS